MTYETKKSPASPLVTLQLGAYSFRDMFIEQFNIYDLNYKYETLRSHCLSLTRKISYFSFFFF